MDNEFVCGAIPSEYDERDYTVTVSAIISFPESYMIRDVEIYNQGSIGNCVMQSIRSAPHAHYGVKPGATFGYGRWRVHGGSGMQPNLACNGFVKEGIPPEKVDKEYLEMPDAKEYAEEHATEFLKAAEPYKGWTWARLYSINEIKATLMQEATRKGLRCIVCLPYYRINSKGYWKVEGGRCSGYHEMVIAGWDNAKGWKLRNSWGKKESGSLGASTADGYVWLAFDDVFACDDVIALFPPIERQEEKTDEKDDVIMTRRTLRLNDPYMCGDDVKECQSKLEKHGHDVGTIDGIFGKNTDKAVRAFQKAEKLTVDGIVGKNTWAALDADGSTVTELDVDAIEELMNMMVGDCYAFGGQGEALTRAKLNELRNNNPGNFKGGKYEFLLSQIELAEKMKRNIYSEDCSGIIMKANEVLKFFKDADMTADNIMDKCTMIDRASVKPGDFLFRVSNGKASHVAWVGREGVYEAAGTFYGVVKREGSTFDRKTLNLKTGKIDTLSAWTHYGRYK